MIDEYCHEVAHRLRRTNLMRKRIYQPVLLVRGHGGRLPYAAQIVAAGYGFNECIQLLTCDIGIDFLLKNYFDECASIPAGNGGHGYLPSLPS
jgi:hypothetical protein